MKVVWLGDARKDVDEICDYIARDNVDAALRIVDRIEERADFLADFPESGRPGQADDAN
jgi:plasmid stabilization system protein ParE